jgi:hypothetical protein
MDEFNYIMIIIILGLIIMFGIPLGIQSNVDKHTLGNMICSESNHSTFIKLDNNIVVCESYKELEKFDGGYIKVVDPIDYKRQQNDN